MLLNEIFNTRVQISWARTGKGHRGDFDLDGTPYSIKLEEYEVQLDGVKCTLVDFGFTANNESFKPTGLGKSAKVFGAIFNGATTKVLQLGCDIILFGVHNQNNSVEERKTLYERLASWWARGSVYSCMSKWFDTRNGSYMLLTKRKLTDTEKDEITQFTDSIPEKNEHD